jgi:5-methylthioadenosine/S-adenosylhomocysteine deaminase
VTSLTLYSDRVVLDDPLRVTPARIEIAGTRIREVTETSRAALDAGTVDLGDRLVSPAFVNGHTHLAMAAFRGLGSDDFAGNVVEDLFFRLESALTPEDIRAFARLGAYECLLSGVAVVWDHYYGGTAVAEALLDTGLSGVVAPTLQDLGGPGAGASEAQLDATLEIAATEGETTLGLPSRGAAIYGIVCGVEIWGAGNECSEGAERGAPQTCGAGGETVGAGAEKRGSGR